MPLIIALHSFFTGMRSKIFSSHMRERICGPIFALTTGTFARRAVDFAVRDIERELARRRRLAPEVRRAFDLMLDGHAHYQISNLLGVSTDKYRLRYLSPIQKVAIEIGFIPNDFRGMVDKMFVFKYKIREYHGWEFVRNRITNFTVFSYNGTETWIDAVRIYGINRDDLR